METTRVYWVNIGINVEASSIEIFCPLYFGKRYFKYMVQQRFSVDSGCPQLQAGWSREPKHDKSRAPRVSTYLAFTKRPKVSEYVPSVPKRSRRSCVPSLGAG